MVGNKTIGMASIIALILIVAGLSVTGVVKPVVKTSTSYLTATTMHKGETSAGRTQPENPSVGGLSEEEKDALLYMVEEEKLARDVYQFLYEKWGLPIFQNIARSEQRHVDSVRALLEKYGIQDPTLGEPAGSFRNPEIASLYKQLVEKGSRSLVDAIKVGLTIEEKDIYDLQEWLSKVNNPDIRAVFCNLMKGSRNHLRAFYKELQVYGGTYTPTYISEKEFLDIIQGTTERGNVSC